MEREEAFEFLGINKFRESGYTGSRVKIMSDERILKEYHNTDKERWEKVICPKGYQKPSGSWHGSSIMHILQDICPDAEYIAFPMDMKGTAKKYESKCIDYILENKVHLFTTSQVGGTNSQAKEKAMQDCIDNGTTFFCAAGNKGDDGMLGEAKSDKHISIGALEPKKPLKWATYSSIGKELDYVSIGFYGFGTSYTTPTFCAMCGLVQDFFIDKTGRALVRSELIDFINDNLIDVEEEGFDIKTGHGLFVLPDPNTINISKYVPEYSGSVDYTGFPEIKEEKKMYKVFLGVGHGGLDSGAVANGLREADINLNIALACQEVLIKHGVEVLLSRYKDENDPIEQEIIECNNYNPDIAIDIHTNAGGGDGFEVYRHSAIGSNSKKLAEYIEKEARELNNSRGIKTKLNGAGKEYYAFIRDTNPPAIIVECAFIDNKEDVKVIDTVEEQKAFGVAYAKGILKYFGIQYMQKNSTENEIVLKIGQKSYTTNGEKKQIEAAPYIENGRTMVPVAVLRDAGCEVIWDGTNQTVTIINEK